MNRLVHEDHQGVLPCGNHDDRTDIDTRSPDARRWR